MSGPMSLREARTKQQKEKSYKNSRLRFRASMKPQRNERSPSEHGDEKSTRKKKIMKIDDTEGEGSSPNVGESSAEEPKVAGDIEMSAESGEVIEKEESSADTGVKETIHPELIDDLSIERALEIVCGEAEEAERIRVAQEAAKAAEAKKEGGSTSTDEPALEKTIDEGHGAGDATGETSQPEKGTGGGLPSLKDDKDNKNDKKKDNDSDDDDDENGKKREKAKKKDKDDDGSGGSQKPDGGNGNDKDDGASGGGKSAGGENKDGDNNDQKGGNDNQNSDDDFDMGGNDEDKNNSDDDLDDLGGSSDDGASDNEGSEVEETENSEEGETELGITDDEESEAESVSDKGVDALNAIEDGFKGIMFDGGEGTSDNREEAKPTTSEEVKKTFNFFGITMGPFDVGSDVEDDDELSFDEDYCQYLSGGSGGDDDYSYHGDDDNVEDVEEVRGTG